MNDNSKVLIGLLAGLAAGAALGLLFAPEAGSETRERLGQSIKDLGDTIQEKAADQLGSLSELKEKVVNSVKGKFDVEDDYEVDVEHAYHLSINSYSNAGKYRKTTGRSSSGR